jgi:hypothetical protein
MALLIAPRRLRPEATAGSRADGAALRLHLPEDPCRAEVEDFIRGVYHRHYGASIQAFTPVLVSLADASGHVVAAAGYRSAGAGALYLERYLREPIEEELGWHSERPITRREVVEVGHLASSQAGAGRRLMLLLGPHLAQQRFRWAVATLTQQLRQMMGRIGVAPLALAAADPAALGEEAVFWGSYYEHAPLVLAGEIQPALRRLARRRLQEQELCA